MRVRWSGACLAAVLASSCAVTERPQRDLPPVPIPETWVAPADGSELAAGPWWETFGDAGLDRAIHEALAYNRDLRAAASRIEAAAAQARIAGADRWPSLAASMDAQRAKQIFPGLPIPGDGVPSSTFEAYAATLSASWEADLWGRIAAGEAAADAELESALLEHAAARHSIAAATAKAWLAWNTARLQRDLAAETVENYERSLEVVQDQYEGGAVSALDVRLAKASLASSQSLEARRGQEVERAVRQLEILMGRYPSGRLEGEPVLADAPPPPPAGLPADLVRRRPDLAAARARLEAADHRVVEANANLYPGLTLTASTGRTSNELKDLLDGDFTFWSIAGSLAQPIFQAGRLRAGVSAAEARAAELLQTWAGAVLTAMAEVETALAIESGLRDEIAFLGEATSEARAARDISEERYRRGRTNLLEVLVAQRRALENESALIEARRRHLEARVDLHLALGGDFDSAAPSDAEGQ